MESASVFAKKHGLEQYLENPGELNDMILKLLILQESMQADAARNARARAADRHDISVRRIAGGKFVASCSGERAYAYAVTTALQGATALVPLFQRGRFLSLLRQMGVPEDRIGEYCATIALHDDTICIDRE